MAEALPAPLPALLFDATHDNATPSERRHAADAAATLALAALAVCAGGSSRGFDLLVPENVSVVADHRRYADAPRRLAGLLRAWERGEGEGAAAAPLPSVAPCVGGPAGARFAVDMTQGLRRVRRRLNALKAEAAARGLSELYCQSDAAPCGADLVTVLRLSLIHI